MKINGNHLYLLSPATKAIIRTNPIAMPIQRSKRFILAFGRAERRGMRGANY